MICVLSMIDSLLALYTKLKGGKCLIYIGREEGGKPRVFKETPLDLVLSTTVKV